jgi:hypothetical protein
MTKRVTPYQRLLDSFREFARGVVWPNRRLMWSYPKARLHEGWNMTELYQRVAAAKQLGYEVHLSATDEGLHVHYVKARPVELPYEIRG